MTAASAPELSARDYHAAAVLQREVATRMAERLAFLKHTPKLILDLGARTGFATRLLQQHFPQALLMAVDTTAQILRQGFPLAPRWKRLIGLGDTAFTCASAEYTRLPLRNQSVDMIWSNLAMHYHDPDTAFKEAQRVLKPGGLFMFSLFGPDTLKELRAASGGVNMKRLIDMHDFGDVLSHNGFTAPVMDMENLTLTYADLKDLLQDLRHTGEENLLPGMLHNAANQNYMTSVSQAYEAFRTAGKLPATYEIIYGHAWNSDTKKTLPDGRQIIEFRSYKSIKS
jgi:malonyl-CoA O-methyltransferase